MKPELTDTGSEWRHITDSHFEHDTLGEIRFVETEHDFGWWYATPPPNATLHGPFLDRNAAMITARMHERAMRGMQNHTH